MSIKNMKYKPQKLFKIKMFFSVILIVLLIVQIAALFNITAAMGNNYRKVTISELETVKDGELVKGIVSGSDVILSYQDNSSSGNLVYCLAVMTENRKVIVITANTESAPDVAGEVANLKPHSGGSISFKGKVGSLTETYYTGLTLNLFMNNLYKEYGITDANLTNRAVALVDDDPANWTPKLMATIAGVIMLLVGLFFLLRKSVNNLIYGILVQKGYLEPELKITKEDIRLSNLDPYASPENDSGNFYVNTDSETDPEATDYKFTSDIPANNGLSAADSAEKPEEENVLRDTLKSNRFLAATGIFGLSDNERGGHAEDSREDTSFYQGGVNEEGNFYVDRNTSEKDDPYSEKKLKY